MTKRYHGLSIGIQRIDETAFLYLKAVGKLSHEDYKTITPLLDSALSGVGLVKMNVFFDASEFQGWELRAAWDDLKLGLKHDIEFEKIAILGNSKWLEYASKISGWFVSGEVKYFEDADSAHSWITARV
uniref:STAS/SEC14 domain-containing protein n=1 Tax=Ningiella ruwaisensis TaxID=2364274 RepID=UPI00109F898A|nr:STAS/SEC14 domain-containing protein [Ningiella ruwaisensis]